MANKRDVGLKISIDGEKEYKQTIAELNRDNAVLASELKKVQEQYKGNEDSMEALTAKQRIYEEQLATQQRKVEEIRTRYEAWQQKLEEVKNTFGASSTQYLEAQRHVEDYRIKLNNAETAEIKMQRAVEENTRAIDAQGEEMADESTKLAGLGDAVSEFAGKLGIQIPQAATDALNGMDKFSAGSVASMGIAAGAIGAVYKVGKELYDLTRAAAAEADALLTRSAQTGIDTGTLQGLDYASRFLDFDGVDKTLVRFTQNMASAAEGADKQAAAFDRLKISVQDEDGELRNNWETFLDAIDALGDVQNATERDAIANDLFGKSYSELKPLIDAGTGALQSYIDEAQKLGYIIEEETVKKLGALDDALQQNEASSAALKNTVAGELAPTFTLLTEGLTAVQDGFRGIVESDAASGFLDFIGSAGSPLFALVSTIKSFADANFEAKAAMEATNEVAPATVETYEQQQAAAQRMSEELATLSEQYNAALTAAKLSLDGQFGLWENAPAVAAKSVEDMIAAQETQADWWTWYGDFIDQLLARDIDGIDKLAEKFANGSEESAAALRGLATASDEEIEKLIQSMNKTEGAKNDVAGTFAALETNVKEKLEGIETSYGNTIETLNLESGYLDFSAFETSVDTAFAFLEERAAAGVEFARAKLSELTAEIGAVGSSAGNPGYNAAGDMDWRGGLTWVGESGPELVQLPRGSAIYSNQESRQIAAAATDTSRIEGLLERCLQRMDGIERELADGEAVRRMA